MTKLNTTPPRPTFNDLTFDDVWNYFKEIEYYCTELKPYKQMLEESFHLANDSEKMMNRLVKFNTNFEFSLKNWYMVDRFCNYASDVLRIKINEWGKNNIINPPYPIGSKVSIKIFNQPIKAIITGIQPDIPAAYDLEITEEEMKTLGLSQCLNKTVVNFEDVELVE